MPRYDTRRHTSHVRDALSEEELDAVLAGVNACPSPVSATLPFRSSWPTPGCA